MESSLYKLKSVWIYVTSTDSKKDVLKKYDSNEFDQLCFALKHATVIALDAEWKPKSSTAALLQLACCGIKATVSDSEKKYEVKIGEQTDCVVFLLDLVEIDISTTWKVLNDMFVSPKILKLGFKFEQDLAILSSTFSSFQGCEAGFEWVEPYIDIARVYDKLQPKQSGGKLSKNNKSLKAICEELLRVSLSKEQQCSDWSCSPLTEEQKAYAAADAECLVEIFGKLVEIFGKFQEKFHKEEFVQVFGEKLLPTASKKRSNTQLSLGIVSEEKKVKSPPLWDLSCGGDGCPKFLCDKNVATLAPLLLSVGFDAVVQSSKSLKELVNKEKRFLLTKDSKVFKRKLLGENAAYLVKRDHKNDQLLEVILELELPICSYHVMVTCMRCIGRTTEDVKAAKRIKHIPGFLNDQRFLFTQCRKCERVQIHVEYKDIYCD